MYPNKQDLEERYNSNIGAVLHFIDTGGNHAKVVGDLYAIRLIMEQTEVFWLQYPVEWNDEY